MPSISSSTSTMEPKEMKGHPKANPPPMPNPTQLTDLFLSSPLAHYMVGKPKRSCKATGNPAGGRVRRNAVPTKTTKREKVDTKYPKVYNRFWLSWFAMVNQKHTPSYLNLPDDAYNCIASFLFKKEDVTYDYLNSKDLDLLYRELRCTYSFDSIWFKESCINLSHGDWKTTVDIMALKQHKRTIKVVPLVQEHLTNNKKLRRFREAFRQALDILESKVEVQSFHVVFYGFELRELAVLQDSVFRCQKLKRLDQTIKCEKFDEDSDAFWLAFTNSFQENSGIEELTLGAELMPVFALRELIKTVSVRDLCIAAEVLFSDKESDKAYLHFRRIDNAIIISGDSFVLNKLTASVVLQLSSIATPGIRRLLINVKKITKEGMDILRQVITSETDQETLFPQLEWLIIKCTYIEGWEILGSALSFNSTIRCLELVTDTVSISGESLFRFAYELRNNQSIEELILSIDNNAAQQLPNLAFFFALLGQLKSLIKLQILAEGNAFGEAQGEFLCAVLAVSTKIDRFFTNICIPGHSFRDALRTSHNLKRLQLNMIDSTIKDHELLCIGLSETKTLSHLVLAASMNQEFGGVYSKMLSKNRSLKVFTVLASKDEDLSGVSKFNYAILHALAYLNNTLLFVELPKCLFMHELLIFCLKILEKQRGVKEIHISMKGLRCDDVMEISRKIAHAIVYKRFHDKDSGFHIAPESRVELTQLKSLTAIHNYFELDIWNSYGSPEVFAKEFELDPSKFTQKPPFSYIH